MEAQEREIARLKSENDRIQGEKDVELSQAFSAGFAAYLENFLAGDPEYDWSVHFAPSTTGYMIDFKAKNAAAIAKARAGLESKIAKERETLANKQEVGGSEARRENNEADVTSPTETTAS